MNEEHCFSGPLDLFEYDYVTSKDYERFIAGLPAEQRDFLEEERAWTELKWEWHNGFMVDGNGRSILRKPTEPNDMRRDRELSERLGVSFEQLSDAAWKRVTPCPQRATPPRTAARDGAPLSDDEVLACYRSYVCSSCYAPMGECACDACWGADSGPWSLTWVDPAIQEHVRILEKKGYSTEFRCAGHEPGEGPVIQFLCLHPFGVTLPVPPGFTWHKFRATLYATPLDADKASTMTPRELKERDERLLVDLLAWCHDLPNHGDNDWYGYCW